MSTLHILDSTGDTTLTWEPTASDELIADIESAFETAKAEASFRRFKALGYRAHKTESPEDTGNDAVITHTFDPTAAAIIMVPQTVGG